MSLKTAQLPPVRVDPAVRLEIESVLRPGETLSTFIENAALEAARRRAAQAAFLARGRASLVEALDSGVLHDLAPALDAMESRLKEAAAARRHAAPMSVPVDSQTAEEPGEAPPVR